jgi:hypothetical protein
MQTLSMNATVSGVPGTAFDTGDIFGLTNLQWQKLINTYRLRVLISMSKRADDNADLNIKTQFATIIGNATTYPIMTANTDNMVYKFVASNQYPPFATGNARIIISKTLVNRCLILPHQLKIRVHF